MVTIIKLGMISIPIMQINKFNSKYVNSPLKRFSPCCHKPVGNKNYCKGCNQEVKYQDILKGLDEKTILSDEQQEKLKEYLENGIIHILGFKDINPNTYKEMLPNIIKSQVIMPSISKGFRKSDIKVFYGLKLAMENLEKYAVVKYVSRGTEHLGYLINMGELLYLETPFSCLNNKEEIERLGKAVSLEKTNEEEFLEQAEEFIKKHSQDNQVEETEVIEEKKVLLKQFIKEIQEGGDKPIEIKIKEENPFKI